jgi:hypothetical protein
VVSLAALHGALGGGVGDVPDLGGLLMATFLPHPAEQPSAPRVRPLDPRPLNRRDPKPADALCCFDGILTMSTKASARLAGAHLAE